MVSETDKKTGWQLILRRGGAYLLDILLLFIVLAPLGGLVHWALLDSLPQTGPEIYRALLWNFSLPVWLYFTLCDSLAGGATLGKRPFRLKVVHVAGQPLDVIRALLRTAVKLLPWELVHLSAFALSADMARLTTLQWVGFIAAYGLIIVYVGLLVITRGRRSVHDLAAQTQVVAA